jgi:hypothetical protein
MHIYDCLVNDDYFLIIMFFSFFDSVGLGYANIELKHEVQNLSSRVTESKNLFSKF